MLTRDQIIETLQKNKPYFNTIGVVSIGLFGSYAKNKQQQDSDVDVLVELAEPDWDVLCTVWNLLEKQLHTKVDLVRKGSHLREKFIQTVEREIIYA
jgi:predicted nucleotidyltransferase